MSEPTLLAVVEVSRERRVRCQALGCSHPIYRRIHVVSHRGAIKLYGSECCKKVFGWTASERQASFTSKEGRLLSAEECQLLVENTEELISSLQEDYLEAERQRDRDHVEEQRAIAASRSVIGSSLRRPRVVHRRPLGTVLAPELEAVAKEAV